MIGNVWLAPAQIPEIVLGVTKKLRADGILQLSVSYTADPDKDPQTETGRKWYDKARQGVPIAEWRQEMEIDWNAKAGSPVYPMYDDSFAGHVCENFTIPPTWPRTVGIDHGLRNPTAAVWFAVSDDGDIFAYREYEVAEQIIDYHARAMLEIEMWDMMQCDAGMPLQYRRWIDPATSQRNSQSGMTVQMLYNRAGYLVYPSENDLSVGIDAVTRALSIDPRLPHIPPRLRILERCVKLRKQFKSYRHKDLPSAAREEANPSELTLKVNDHLVDAARYGLVKIMPRAVKRENVKSFREKFLQDIRERAGIGGNKCLV